MAVGWPFKCEWFDRARAVGHRGSYMHNLAVVAHLCDRLAVMRQGRIVETATAAELAQGTLTHPYSRQLLASSKGYSRAAARLAAADPPQVDGP